jgi:hypothetical protein
MEIMGDISMNCRTMLIDSCIDESLNKLIQSKIAVGELVLAALTEMPLSGYILTTGFRLQE